jgi:ankyrin repeat protein
VRVDFTQLLPAILCHLLSAGVPISLRTAIHCRRMDIIRRLLESGSEYTHNNLISICESGDLDFIINALNLYRERIGNSTAYQSSFASHSSIVPSLHVIGNGSQTSIDSSSTTQPWKSLQDDQNVQERLIAASILALPEELHRNCLNGCLYSAISIGSKSYINMFTQLGAELSDRGLCSVLDQAPEFISYVLDNVELLDTVSIHAWTKALDLGLDTSIMKRLLNGNPGIGINGRSAKLHTQILAETIKASRSDLVTYILERGVAVNRLWPVMHDLSWVGIQCTPLTAAIVARNTDLVYKMLSLGADTRDPIALREAVFAGYTMIHTLVSSPHRPLYQNAHFGWPALQLAIILKEISIVDLLLSSGVPVDEVDQVKFTTKLHVAPKYVVRQRETALETAIIEDRGKDLTILKMILCAYGDLNKSMLSEAWSTLLLFAIKKSNQDAISLLLEMGVNPNAKAVHGLKRTPLQAAAEKGNITLVKMLLSMGAEVNALPAKYHGGTALQLVAGKGFLNIARFLLSNGADVNAAGSVILGRTALEAAAENGRIDMISLLFQAGVTIQGPRKAQFERAKEFATKNGHYAARELLESFYAEQSTIVSQNFGGFCAVSTDSSSREENNSVEASRSNNENMTILASSGVSGIPQLDNLSGDVVALWDDFMVPYT